MKWHDEEVRSARALIRDTSQPDQSTWYDGKGNQLFDSQIVNASNSDQGKFLSWDYEKPWRRSQHVACLRRLQKSLQKDTAVYDELILRTESSWYCNYTDGHQCHYCSGDCKGSRVKWKDRGPCFEVFENPGMEGRQNSRTAVCVCCPGVVASITWKIIDIRKRQENATGKMSLWKNDFLPKFKCRRTLSRQQTMKSVWNQASDTRSKIKRKR